LKNNKIVWIDFGYFMFRAIYGWKNNRSTPPTYMCLASIISNLKKVGLRPEDTVIIAVDSPKGNWRKEIDSEYKANRKEKREQEDIDWKKIFAQFQELLEVLEANTPFHSIVVDKMEADDIIAYGCKRFQDQENIILSADSDYEQLCVYPKVKLFSPLSKRYKHVDNPYRVLLKKIRKETADNLVTPILTQEDYKKRKLIVNLVDLPEEIEQAIDPFLDNFHEKNWNYERIYFPTLRERLKTIYSQDYIVSFTYKPKKRIKPSKKLEL